MPLRRRAVALAAALAATGAHAAAIDIGESDSSLRLDNTLKLGLMARTKDADPALADSFRLLVPNVPASAFPQALNFNAGDDNFRRKGLVSKRVDLLTEFDAVYRGLPRPHRCHRGDQRPGALQRVP